MKNKLDRTPEELLIDTYKHIDSARTQIDHIINLIGSRHQSFIHHLPDDIRQLVELTLQLPPEKREIVRRFIESLNHK